MKVKVTFTIDQNVINRLRELSAYLTIKQGKHYSMSRLVEESLKEKLEKSEGF